MSDRTSAETITVYADYVCPFCYLGHRTLSQYRRRREEPLEVDWRPFDLRYDKRDADGSIDHTVDDGKDDDYYEQARSNVRRLQERYGVEMAHEIATDVDSRPAQLVSFAIAEREPERWETFDDAVYEALWRESRDIGDRDVLVDVAERAGLPQPETSVGEFLDDDDLAARLEDRFADARRAGVTGVPTFVADGHTARGAVPPEHLARLLEGT